jgi:hypothetical protein
MSNVYRFRESMAWEQWIFKQEDPNNPEWCTESQPFIAWGEDRISGLARNPTDGNIVRLTAALVENYAERVMQASAEHRPETNHGTHRCLHEALFVLWRRIREIKLDRQLPDLEPQVVMMPAPDTMEEKPAPEPTLEDVTDVIAGTYVQG